jgi:hypothetical protein
MEHVHSPLTSSTGRSGSAAAPRASLRTRVRVWWAEPQLDAELAAGEQPRTPELRLRAAQLTEPGYLSALAQTIEEIVDESNAREPSVVSLQRGEVVAAHAPLLRLAERLREGHVPPTAAAIVSQLVRSPGSPLYDRAADRSACELATRALELADAERKTVGPAPALGHRGSA